jgi:hypothetical protein
MISPHDLPIAPVAGSPNIASAALFQATICPDPSTANAESDVLSTNSLISRIRIRPTCFLWTGLWLDYCSAFPERQ